MMYNIFFLVSYNFVRIAKSVCILTFSLFCESSTQIKCVKTENASEWLRSNESMKIVSDCIGTDMRGGERGLGQLQKGRIQTEIKGWDKRLDGARTSIGLHWHNYEERNTILGKRISHLIKLCLFNFTFLGIFLVFKFYFLSLDNLIYPISIGIWAGFKLSNSKNRLDPLPRPDKRLVHDSIGPTGWSCLIFLTLIIVDHLSFCFENNNE